MAYIGKEVEDDEAGYLVVRDSGPVGVDDKVVNTKGASVNYVIWDAESLAPFCADRSSFKGDEE